MGRITWICLLPFDPVGYTDATLGSSSFTILCSNQRVLWKAPVHSSIYMYINSCKYNRLLSISYWSILFSYFHSRKTVYKFLFIPTHKSRNHEPSMVSKFKRTNDHHPLLQSNKTLQELALILLVHQMFLDLSIIVLPGKCLSFWPGIIKKTYSCVNITTHLFLNGSIRVMGIICNVSNGSKVSHGVYCERIPRTKLLYTNNQIMFVIEYFLIIKFNTLIIKFVKCFRQEVLLVKLTQSFFDPFDSRPAPVLVVNRSTQAGAILLLSIT